MQRDDRRIERRFCAIAAEYPERPALLSDAANWTYRQLYEQAHLLADRLADHGISDGSPVAIRAQREPGVVIAMLAVLLSRGAFAVLDSNYPRQRLAQLTEALRPAVVLHPSDRPGGWNIEDGPVGASARQLPAADDLGYLAFTSGTSGVPKLVLGGHRPVRHYLDWSATEFGYTADDSFAMLSGLGHDPLLRDVFGPLSIGASVAVPDTATWSRPERLARWLADRRVTVAHLTPTMARRLVAVSKPGSLPSLRRVLLGGEPLYWHDLRTFAERAPAATFVNVYGATETPQVAIYHVATAE